MNFKIPIPRMPSQEELLASSKESIKIHERIRPDHWSKGLVEIAAPFKIIEIPQEHNQQMTGKKFIKKIKNGKS